MPRLRAAIEASPANLEARLGKIVYCGFMVSITNEATLNFIVRSLLE